MKLLVCFRWFKKNQTLEVQHTKSCQENLSPENWLIFLSCFYDFTQAFNSYFTFQAEVFCFVSADLTEFIIYVSFKPTYDLFGLKVVKVFVFSLQYCTSDSS